MSIGLGNSSTAILSDERLREKELYRFTQFNWEVILAIAGRN